MPLIRKFGKLLRRNGKLASAVECCDCCGERGGCDYRWTGAKWSQISDNCNTGEFPSSRPGCVWEFCQCPFEEAVPGLIGRSGLFVGEVYTLCCICTERCEL